MKVFISFSDLYYLVDQGRINFSDLETGLFIFKYTREMIFGRLPAVTDILKAEEEARNNGDYQTYSNMESSSPVACHSFYGLKEKEFCRYEMIIFGLQTLLLKAEQEGRLLYSVPEKNFYSFSHNVVYDFLVKNKISLPENFQKLSWNNFYYHRELYDILRIFLDVVPLI